MKLTGIKVVKRHRGGSWWAARQLEKRDRAQGKESARKWFARYVAELAAIGVIVGPPTKGERGQIDHELKVPLNQKAAAEAITAKFAIAGKVETADYARLVLAAWRERFEDFATLHLLTGSTKDPETGADGEALIIGVELLHQLADEEAIAIMRECVERFGFPPGVQSCSLVQAQPPVPLVLDSDQP